MHPKSTKTTCIALADDDARMVRLVRSNLEKTGYRVVTATDGPATIELVETEDPDLLVLDEPTSALDPLMQEVLHNLLRRLAAAGHTIFFSSHSLGEVEQLCDRVAIVRDGELVADESLTALRDRAGHNVIIRWKNESKNLGFEPPPFLKLSKREDALWEGTLEGPAHRLVDFLAGKPLEDLTIGRPDLESLFRRFYQREQEGGR